MKRNEEYMRLALVEAKKAYVLNEAPIGAVIVFEDGNVIGKGYNLRESEGDPTLHAEIIAIREAAQYVGGWRLHQCRLFTTLEPCPMCAGAIVQARIKEVVFGANDAKAGCAGTLMNLLNDGRLNHQCTVVSGVLEKSCSGLLTSFFQDLRKKKNR